MTRLFYQLNELQAIETKQKSVAKVLIAPMTDDMEEAVRIGNAFREAGIPTEVYLEDKKIKAKFKYADRLQVPFVVTIGEDEIQNNTVSLKNMETGEQEVISIQEAIAKLK